MNKAKKAFAKLVTGTIALIIALIFISGVQNDAVAIEKELNGTYDDYEASPDDFIVTEAEIIEEFESDTGSTLNFFKANEWLVSVKIDDNDIQTTVMRDAKKDEVGDVIEIAYKKYDDYIGYDSDNLNATQLRYIRDTGARNTCTILRIVCIVLFAALVGWTLISYKKSDE